MNTYGKYLNVFITLCKVYRIVQMEVLELFCITLKKLSDCLNILTNMLQTFTAFIFPTEDSVLPTS